jgi:hypothetical protein
MQTILLSDLVACGSPSQKVMAVWRTFLLNLKPAKQSLTSISEKNPPNGHFIMHGTFVPDWMGSTALLGHITSFFSRADKPSEDINTAFTVSLMNPSFTQYQFLYYN